MELLADRDPEEARKLLDAVVVRFGSIPCRPRVPRSCSMLSSAPMRTSARSSRFWSLGRRPILFS
jgi:hypothetical protein